MHDGTSRLWLLACAGMILVSGCDRGQQQGGFFRPPTPVETAKVAVGPVADSFTAVGSIEAGESILVTSEIDGVIISLPFREGHDIDVGAPIAQLDDDQLRAEVDRAEALRDQSENTFKRIESIVQQGAGAAQDLDDAAAALKVAEANLALARARLAKTRITAPFAGIVGARRVSPGTFLRAGAPITDLAQIDRLRVTFSAPERILGQLKRGAEVSVTTTAFPDQRLQGTIDVIDPQLDPGTRSAQIIAHADNPDRLFRPGMSATVTVVLSERSQALTIPSEAVFVEGGQAFVFAVKSDSTVTRTLVELGTRLADAVEIRSGLVADQRVVSAGHQKLYEGAKIMPISGQGGPGGAPPGASAAGQGASGDAADGQGTPPGAPTGNAPADESPAHGDEAAPGTKES